MTGVATNLRFFFLNLFVSGSFPRSRYSIIVVCFVIITLLFVSLSLPPQPLVLYSLLVLNKLIWSENCTTPGDPFHLA